MSTLIPINRILANPQQPRREFDELELEELAASIRSNGRYAGDPYGVITAITVEADSGWYIIQDGERRWRAAKIAGLKEIPATIAPSLNGSSAKERLLRALAANIQRLNLNPIEEARAYEQLRDVENLSLAEIARRVGKSENRITSRLNLLRLEEPIRNLIAQNALHRDIRFTNALLSIPDSEVRVKLAERLAGTGVKLNPAISACLKVAEQLNQPKAASKSPMLHLGGRAAKQSDLPPAEWNCLFQVNRVPPWPVVSEAAMATCDDCGFRDIASEETCRQCPAVDFLRRMLEAKRK